ncbi:hypothetical protein BAS10_06815 [Elizabethkingia meningoseptica]|uniref:hypothetical protein n=1 Tax=Elizabethkingia meningoseptica TaxID=238 RepID=UPI00099984B9|nr:hypothetical protein [Elizabethkingia meningoseptica]OPB96756.1 hypothetical protein BAS10_06815 [Elizabethkingia meningoseptica]
MKHKTAILTALIVGTLSFHAQTLTPSNIWYDVINNHNNTDNLLHKKGFKLKYNAPKKQGGGLSCYFNKQYNEWLFIHNNEQNQTTQVSYLLPTLQKYLKNMVDKKQLLAGEDVEAKGKTSMDNKLYYHLIYTFQKPELPSAKK